MRATTSQLDAIIDSHAASLASLVHTYANIPLPLARRSTLTECTLTSLTFSVPTDEDTQTVQITLDPPLEDIGAVGERVEEMAEQARNGVVADATVGDRWDEWQESVEAGVERVGWVLLAGATGMGVWWVGEKVGWW